MITGCIDNMALRKISLDENVNDHGEAKEGKELRFSAPFFHIEFALNLKSEIPKIGRKGLGDSPYRR